MAQRPRYRRLVVYVLATGLLLAFFTEFIARRILPQEMTYVSAEKYWRLADHTNIFGNWDDAVLFRVGDYTATRRKKLWPQRVVCLGGAGTYGAGLVKRSEGYPGVLNSLLADVEVVNGGVSGYNAFQLYVYLRDVLILLKPDVVIFNYGLHEGLGESTKAFYPRAQAVATAWRQRGVRDLETLQDAVRRDVTGSVGLWLHRRLDRSKAFLWWRDRAVTGRIVTETVGALPRPPTTATVLADLAKLTADHDATLIFVPEITADRRFASGRVWSLMQALCADQRARCVDPLTASPGLSDGELFVDASYLNEAGHRRLALTILPVLREALGGGGDDAPEI